MHRSLAEAAANCTRNIATGYGPLFSDRKGLGGAAVLTPEIPAKEHPCGAGTGSALDSASLPKLLAALQAPDCCVRVNAVCDLAQLGPQAQAAVPALLATVKDRDWVVRVAAITALGEIGADARDAVPALIESLASEDVRASAAIALGRIGPEARAAIGALTVLKQSKSGFLKWCAEEALRAIGA